MRAAVIRRIASCVLLTTFIILLLAKLPVLACSNGLEVTEVTKDFFVEVRDSGKPVSGIKVELRTYVSIAPDEGKPVTETTTDAHGRAQFKAVAAGEYYVAVKHPAASPAIAVRIGKAGVKTTDNITLEWPGMAFAQTKTVSGTLQGLTSTDRGFIKDLSDPIYKPLVGSKITLSKAITNDTVGSAVTGEGGSFHLADVPPGNYFLHVDAPPKSAVRYMQSDGYVPLTVTPASSASTLNLALIMHECGGAAYVLLGENGTNHAQAH